MVAAMYFCFSLFFFFEHFNLPIFGALLNFIFELRRIIVIPSPRDGASCSFFLNCGLYFMILLTIKDRKT